MQDLSRRSPKHASSAPAGKDGCNVRPHVLLVTGRPGVGKTMVVRRVADGSHQTRLRGFCTKETREQGERKSNCQNSYDGEDGVIAHVEFPKPHRVSKYGLDLTAIDDAASLLAHDPAVQLYLERILTGLSRQGFPKVWKSDSRCGLVKEASLHDETSFDGPEGTLGIGG